MQKKERGKEDDEKEREAEKNILINYSFLVKQQKPNKHHQQQQVYLK